MSLVCQKMFATRENVSGGSPDLVSTCVFLRNHTRPACPRSEHDAPVGCPFFLALAHNLGLAVVAEGTETLEEVNELLALDCEYAQGYFFSRPVDEASAAHLLRTGYCSQKPSSRVATAELPSLPIRSPRLLIT